jgi:hypothetical protein
VRRTLGAGFLAGCLAVTTLTGCALGERPSDADAAGTIALGGEPGTSVGDAAVDGILTVLEQADGPGFAAKYHITRRLGPVDTDASVTRQDDKVSVTVRDVLFQLGDHPKTCTVSSSDCQDGVIEQRISDTGVGSTFWSTAPARALRVTYTRKSGPPTPSTATIAGVSVQCVDIPVGGGTERYCVTPLGPIALWDTADKRVELTELRDSAGKVFGG